jgi:hypothetical protein
MGRSIGAVIVGFLYALATIGLLQMVLWFAFPEEPGVEGAGSVPQARWILIVGCTFLGSILSGFITAYFAGGAELVHGLIVGGLLVAVLGVTTLILETEPVPAWYQLALPGVTLPGTLLGAGLRARLRRPPPPALPPSSPA